MNDKPIYMQRDEERQRAQLHAWSELCEAAAALGVAFARMKQAIDGYADATNKAGYELSEEESA